MHKKGKIQIYGDRRTDINSNSYCTYQNSGYHHAFSQSTESNTIRFIYLDSAHRLSNFIGYRQSMKLQHLENNSSLRGSGAEDSL